MGRRWLAVVGTGIGVILALQPLAAAPADSQAAAVDGAALVAADQHPGDWMSYGRTYGEQHYSPLDKINADNVHDLGLAWYADIDSSRGQESVPLEVGGVLYVSTAWSMVKAFDAKTGRQLWSFDPEVPRDWVVHGCCDAVNRGVALWQGKVYVGTYDGRLIALDAKTGRKLWSRLTVERGKSYTITGAPRIIKGKVLIGNGGAEFGVRGYVSAYDADTGKLVWRFYTVPGDPAKGFESKTMEMAAKTWSGRWWRLGGGGTVWDSMAYDPELDLLYIGVGNGSPWNAGIRSPGGGDNLFLSSIVALKPDTGEYVWHYQTTPNESWDYTAAQTIIVADLPIDGKPRRVVMQAPKNGFFYVLDARTGQFLSGEKFIPANWATGIDKETGRPIENPAARYYQTGQPFVAMPGPAGAHSWQPMAFSPKTGMAYIPAQELGFVYAPDKNFKASPMGFNVGADFAAGALPQVPTVKQAIYDGQKGYLLAWDPVTEKQVWRADHMGPWDGGILATGGNLVAQGTSAGSFEIYRADNGDKLWSTEAQTAVMAGPITYMIDGEQYIAVMAGWGGVYALAPGELSTKGGNIRNISRLLVFKLGGAEKLPPPPPEEIRPLNPPAQKADAATIDKGRLLYARFCGVCHGDSAVSAGLVPDLRTSPLLDDDGWFDAVLQGSHRQNGMASFAQVLDRKKAVAVRAYVVQRAHDALEEQKNGTALKTGQ